MTWRKASDYAIQRGKQAIAKVHVRGCDIYVLTDGEERIGHYDEAQKAKDMADQIRAKSREPLDN